MLVTKIKFANFTVQLCYIFYLDPIVIDVPASAKRPHHLSEVQVHSCVRYLMPESISSGLLASIQGKVS